jgi:hypothetical protein
MNVYQQTYTEQFINELPVDFNKIKNMDLNTIPHQYHRLFTTDWNWGKFSKMTMNERRVLHEIFLDYQHNDLQALLLNE